MSSHSSTIMKPQYFLNPHTYSNNSGKSEFYNLQSNGNLEQILIKSRKRADSKDCRTQSMLLSGLGLILILSGGFVVIFLCQHIFYDDLFPVSHIVKISVSSYLSEVSILFILTASLILTGGVVFIAGTLAIIANFLLLLTERKQTFYWLLFWVLSFTILSFIALLAISVVAILSRGLIQDQLEAGLVSKLKSQYAMPGGEFLTRVLDLVQNSLQCCGLSGPEDYDNSDWQGKAQGEGEKLRIPLTCCTPGGQAGAETFLNPSPLNLSLCQSQEDGRFRYSKGCKPLLESYVSQLLVIIVGVALGSSVANITVLSVIAFFWRNIIS